MKKHHDQKNSRYLLWPLLVLALLTIGVFFTTYQVPQQQNIRSQAQVYQKPALFAQDFSAPEIETPTPTVPTPPPQVADAVINIAFSLPGTSSQDANTNPIHKTRNITLNFYDTDTNSQDREAVPLYSIIATAVYDTETNSPTYLKFVGRNINLKEICASSGKCIPPKRYQIALKTYQSLQKIIKTKETDFAGRIYEINHGRTFNLNFGELIIGDIVPVPNGDNLVDGDDISAVLNCVGEKMDTPSCKEKNGADFDDNGVVNEIDHDLLQASIERILELGGIVPTPSPSVPEKKKPTPTPTPVPTATNTIGSILIFMGVVVILLIAGTVLLLTNPRFKAFRLKKKIEGKEFYIKKQSDDKEGKGMWLTLADDSGTKLGHYRGLEIQEGFGHIKGEIKQDNGKEYIEVTDIMWDQQR